MNFTNSPAVGSVNVQSADGSGANVGGTCYDLSAIGEQCDDDGDGIVVFDGVPAGDYTVTQTSVPDGYSVSDPVHQPVSVAAGEAAQVSFLIGVATGTVNVNVVDEAGNAIAGACFSLDGADEFCDSGAGTGYVQ